MFFPFSLIIPGFLFSVLSGVSSAYQSGLKQEIGKRIFPVSIPCLRISSFLPDLKDWKMASRHDVCYELYSGKRWLDLNL